MLSSFCSFADIEKDFPLKKENTYFVFFSNLHVGIF